MIRYSGYLLLLGLLGACALSCAPKGAIGALTGNLETSGISVFPALLYSGENEVVVRCESGLRELKVKVKTDMPGLVRVEGDGESPGCPGERVVRIWLGTTSEDVEVRIGGKNCAGTELREVSIRNKVWMVDRVNLPDVEVGKTSCGWFRVHPGSPEIIDSVTFPDSLPVRLGFETSELTLPLVIPAGKELVYGVCFTGKTPGRYVFPVTTWMRREAPYGRLTNYPVSDTAVVKVLEGEEEREK